MFTRRRSPPPASPPPPAPPERDGKVRVFHSRAHLVAWFASLYDAPRPLIALTPTREVDLSRAFGLLAAEPNGGALYLPTPDRATARALRAWIAAVASEHQPDAFEGPYPVRVGEEHGLLIGVLENAPPSSWEDLEPDGWPVVGFVEGLDRLDHVRVARLLEASPFARPVGRSEREHEEETLLGRNALRVFRGRLVPMVAGLVALGEQPERHLPGMAVVLRQSSAPARVFRTSWPALREQVLRESGWWSGVPREVAEVLLVLALAERAWAGPGAATPITVTREAGRLRLSVPTAPANAREREDRAPGNPRLRQLLGWLGALPCAGEEAGILDNDAVMAWIRAQWPGARYRYGRGETRIELPVVEGAAIRSAGPASAGEPALVVRVPHAAGPAAPGLEAQGGSPHVVQEPSVAPGESAVPALTPELASPTLAPETSVPPTPAIAAMPVPPMLVSTPVIPAPPMPMSAPTIPATLTPSPPPATPTPATPTPAIPVHRETATPTGTPAAPRPPPAAPASPQPPSAPVPGTDSRREPPASKTRNPGSIHPRLPQVGPPRSPPVFHPRAASPNLVNPTVDTSRPTADRRVVTSSAPSQPAAPPSALSSPMAPPASAPPASPTRLPETTPAPAPTPPPPTVLGPSLTGEQPPPPPEPEPPSVVASAPVGATPPPVATARPPVPPSTGPLTLDERKAQLRAFFAQADRPLGVRELAEALGVHRDTLRGAINALVAEGWLETTDPNPRSPVQRYRRVAS